MSTNEELDLSKPEYSEAFKILHEKAHEFILDRQEYLENHHGFDDISSYRVDQEKSTIIFQLGDNTEQKFKFQIIGELNKETLIWTWWWNNSEIAIDEKEILQIVKDYGEFYDFPALTKPTYNASVEDAWVLSAISTYLSGGYGIFRLNLETSYHFIYFREILL